MSAIGPAPLVYLITDRRATAGRPLDDVVGLALSAVADGQVPAAALAVQLREKDLGGRELFECALRLRRLTSAVGVRLFINDRVDVALAAGADGVHLPRGAMRLDEVRAIAPGLEIALSTHTLEQITQAANDGGVSFAVFGPVFDTPSKRQYGPALGIDRLGAACAAARLAARPPLPVLAIGGIDIAKIQPCRDAGAWGIACIRAVLRNDNPKAVVKSFFEAIEST